MVFYLLSTFFSALSNILGLYFLQNGFIHGYTRQNFSDLILHSDILNLILFTIIYLVKKSKNQIHFSIKDTFTNKHELKQIPLFAIPIFAAYYKTVILEFIDASHIAITAMIKPLLVGLLAVLFLKEKINKKSLKYALLALCGFYISNLKKMGVVSNEILYLGSYVLIASFGDITRRFYCRKRSEDMQALCVECAMFAMYSFVILSYKGTFSFKLLFNPLVFLISCITFLHHFCLVHGVRKASSVVALEFVNLSKPIFTMLLSAIFMQDYPDKFKIVGATIIAVSVIGFNAIERQSKKLKTVKVEK